MLSLERCRELLSGVELPDAAIEGTRDSLTALAEIMLDEFMARKSVNTLGPDDVPQALREEFEERAAIREFEGGMSRDSAERAAFADVLPFPPAH